MKNNSYQSIFKEQSTKSLSKYKSESIEARVNQLSKEFLVGAKNNKNVPSMVQHITVSQTPQLNKTTQIASNNQKANIPKEKSMNNVQQLKAKIQSMQENIIMMGKNEQDLKKKLKIVQQIQQQKQQKHLQNIVQLTQKLEQKQNEWIQQKAKLKEEVLSHKDQCENMRILVQQLRKKNQDLVKNNNKLLQQLQMERQCANLYQIKAKDDMQRLKDQYQQQLRRYQFQEQQLVRLRGKMETEKQQSQKYLKQLTLKLQQCHRWKIQIMSEIESNYVKKQIYDVQIQRYQDNIQKLQLRLREQQLLHRQNYQHQHQHIQSKQCQKQNQLIQKQLEDKINGIKQLQIIIQELKRDIKSKLQQVNQKQHLNLELLQSIKLEKQKSHRFQSKIKESQQNLQQLRSQNFSLEEKVIQLTNTNRALKFEKNDYQSHINKLQHQIKQKQKVIVKVEAISHDYAQQLGNNKKRCDELYKQLEKVSKISQNNQKLQQQIFKTLGRVIQINNKITLALQINMEMIQQNSREQSLNDAINYLNNLIQALSNRLKESQIKNQIMERQRASQIKQFCTIIQRIKRVFPQPNIQRLFVKYIEQFSHQRYVNDENNTEQKDQVYHELLQALVLLTNTFILNNKHNESADKSSFLKIESTKKYHKNNLEAQDLYKNNKKSYKNLFDDEQKLNNWNSRQINEQNKQNIDWNRIKTQHNKLNDVQRDLTKEKKRYANEIKQRISLNKPSRGESNNIGSLKNEIEKKYFRN